MPTTMPEGYYNRFDPAKNYDQHLFRAGYAVQSAEFNEVQSNFANRIQGVADALFRDGDVVRDARIIVNAEIETPPAEGRDRIVMRAQLHFPKRSHALQRVRQAARLRDAVRRCSAAPPHRHLPGPGHTSQRRQQQHSLRQLRDCLVRFRQAFATKSWGKSVARSYR